MAIDRGLRRAFRSSEIRDFYDELIDLGGSSWVDGGTHIAVRLPDGKVMRMSTTATGRRYVALLRSKLRRQMTPPRARTTLPRPARTRSARLRRRKLMRHGKSDD